jgi:phage regulator Rha-like protein
MNERMRMRGFLLLLLFLSSCICAEKLSVLPEIKTPSRMVVAGNQLYIRDMTTIYLYSMDNFKLLKKFGRTGNGPGEFKYPPAIRVYPEYLSLQDIGHNKISFFFRDGVFKNEMKAPEDVADIYQVDGNYIGTYSSIEPESLITWKNINLYDKDLKQIKELFKWQGQESIYFSKGNNKKHDWEVIKDYLGYDSEKDRIYLADTRKGFFITVYDNKGNKIYDIKKEYKKRAVTAQFKKKYKEDMEKAGLSKNLTFVFRDFFPAFEKFAVKNGKIYVWTYKKRTGCELIILDLHGNFLKKSILSWRFPYSLKDFKYYYLFKNDAKEYELHVDSIK